MQFTGVFLPKNQPNQKECRIIMEINNSVAAWSAGLAAQRLPRWDELPDIDLYLDQVLTLLDKYLGPFLPENGGHALTASMINNYVKLRIVPAPVKNVMDASTRLSARNRPAQAVCPYPM
ncbi:MAG: DUF1836 domain-containing protein [Ruthenibacterium lactatiformans]